MVKILGIEKIEKCEYKEPEFIVDRIYEEPTEKIKEIIEKLFNDEEVEGFEIEIDGTHFPDVIWDENNTKYFDVCEMIDKNKEIHYLVKTDFPYKVMEKITNKSNDLILGAEYLIDKVWYKLSKIEKSELGGEYKDHFFKILFNKTLKAKEEMKKLKEISKTRVVNAGEKYRHFKDKEYEVLHVAEHTETGESMVVYKAMYEPFKIYTRPYDMFVSPVDTDKYPRVEQKFRMEKIEA